MPDVVQDRGERRVDAWRRSIALFDRTTHEEGPFHAAGYTAFVLEPKTDDGLTPDIVAAARDRFVVCDISISPNKDTERLRRYRASGLTPFLRSRLGASEAASPGGSPFYLTPERSLRDFPRDVNAVQLVSPYDKHLAEVRDPALEDALERWPGFQRPPPNYSLLAVPECDLAELKYPVAGVLKQRAVLGEPVEPEAVARALLGDRADDFRPQAIRELAGKVESLLEQAAARLDDYAKWDRTRRVLTFQDSKALFENSSSRLAVANRIAAWLGTPFIEQFGDLDDDDGADDEDDAD